MINQVVDQRYEVLEKVGESELFTVYRAKDKSANRMVAIKLINPDLAQEEGFAREMMQGIKNAATLSHSNLATTYELKPYENTGYTVTEYVRGINLKERIRRIAPFGLSAAVDFAISITEALNYVHSTGVAHGDLRPQNIIISPEGVVKLTDLGTQPAIALSSQAQAAILRYSAPYHAPELSMAQKGNPAGDLYAIGCIFYEMLTGTPVYSGDSLEAVADQHAFSPIPSVRVINPGVPKAVEGILIKCLQKKPSERYRSASELLTDLQAVRDALRFGKSLSWSPIDPAKSGALPVRPTQEVNLTMTSEQLAPPEAVEEDNPTPSPETKRAKPERISVFLRASLVFVSGVILVAIIVIGGIFLSQWTVPKAVTVPSLVGKSIEEVREITKKLDVRLQEHAEYSDMHPKSRVFKVDKDIGSEMRQKQTINVWYSRGSTYVDVPKLTALTRDEAEKKLREAGLVLGAITEEHDDKIPTGKVLRQADKHRVLHDTPIDIVLSTGPKEVPPPPTPTEGGESANKPPTEGGNVAGGADGNSEVNEFSRTIRIGQDGLGKRQVRIDYEDFLGLHTAIDEEHDEGDPVQVSFSYVGKKIKLRILYNDRLAKEITIDPKKQQGRIG